MTGITVGTAVQIALTVNGRTYIIDATEPPEPGVYTADMTTVTADDTTLTADAT